MSRRGAILVACAVGLLLAGLALGGLVKSDAVRPAAVELHPVEPGGPAGLASVGRVDGETVGPLAVWGLEPGGRYRVEVSLRCGEPGLPAIDDLVAGPDGVAFARMRAPVISGGTVAVTVFSTDDGSDGTPRVACGQGPLEAGGVPPEPLSPEELSLTGGVLGAVPVAEQVAAQELRQALAWRPPAASEDRSRAVGRPHDGRLRNGLLLPAQGRDFKTFDPILERAPSREWRRYATGRLLRVVYAALRDYREANPRAPRVLVGDLSRPRGGWFGREYGGLGHASHQNGLDIDLYYPRRDGRQRKAARASKVDRRLAQALVDAFVARPEVQHAFVGLNVGLTGPPRRVQRLAHHDDHVHIRVLGSRR